MDILKQIADLMKQRGINVNIKVWGRDREKTKNIGIWKAGEVTDKAVMKYQDRIKEKKA